MIFTTRCWSGMTVLLCALLLQNCQPHFVSAVDNGAESQPAASPSSASAMRQRTSSGSTATRSLAPPGTPPAAFVSSSRLSTTLTSKEGLSAIPSVRSLNPVVRHTLATMSNSPKTPYHLPVAAMPKTSRVVPLGNKLGASSPIFTTSSGECVRFIQIDGQWCAAVQAGYEVATSQRTLPVVGPADVGSFLSWLREQDKWTLRARIHILKMPQAPYDSCVYLGKAGLLGGAPASFDQEASQRSHTASRMAFGAEEWRHYYGEVGEEPALPDDIEATLDAPCPFWCQERKKVRDTHLLVLIPATVDGALFTLSLLEDLIQHPKNGGYETEYEYYDEDTKAQFGNNSPCRSYWLLMTRDVLPESRSKTYAAQQKLIADHARDTGLPYELPKVLEAATAILTHHVRNGERLYSDSPWTYTRCQELTLYESEEDPDESGKYHAVVGGFESSGLDVSYYDYDYDSVGGVAGCRKFF
jgi:hypothetical protein